MAEQSQGGSMVILIAKRYRVARMLDFSGGLDQPAYGGGVYTPIWLTVVGFAAP